MWQASRIAMIAAGLMLTHAAPTRPAQVPAPVFDRLLADYTAGNVDAVAHAVTTQRDLDALRPALNAALSTWRGGITRVQAVFLLEFAVASAERNWPVPPGAGGPSVTRQVDDAASLIRQIDLLWSQGSPLGTSPRNNAFTVVLDQSLVALTAQGLTNSPQRLDSFLDVIQARFEHSPLMSAERRVFNPRFSLARAAGPEILLYRERDLTGALDRDVRNRFAKAIESPDALPETFVRGAMVRLRAGNPVSALSALDRFKDPGDDPALTYWAWLFRGRALAALDRPSEADFAYRKALEVSPHAQSAGVALASLYLFWNNPNEAQRWAADVLTSRPDTIDPWWYYAQGDYRFVPAWLRSLRAAAP